MKRLLNHSIGLALLAVLSWSATAHGADWSFSLDGVNTSVDAGGNVLQTNGAGTFNDDDETVIANGRFTLLDATGAVTGRGRWSATAFVDFSQGDAPAPGGPSPGFQAGILDITVTFFPVGGDPVTDLDMRVVCNIPGTVFQTGLDNGTTVDGTGTIGNFSDADELTSFTLFNDHQN